MPQTNQLWDASFLKESPWLSGLAEPVAYFTGFSRWPTLIEYTEFVEQRRAKWAPECQPVTFVEPTPKRHRAPKTQPIVLSTLYDGSIHLRSQVPCFASSYHDLFNVLIWSAFPRAKRALHARQFRALSEWVPHGATRLPGARTREQDALTVFDEGGSVVLHSHGQESPVQIFLFGHALLEHALYRRPKVRSSALLVEVNNAPPAGEELLCWVDQQVAARLNNVADFQAPGVDGVLEIHEDGQTALFPHAPS